MREWRKSGDRPWQRGNHRARNLSLTGELPIKHAASGNANCRMTWAESLPAQFCDNQSGTFISGAQQSEPGAMLESIGLSRLVSDITFQAPRASRFRDRQNRRRAAALAGHRPRRAGSVRLQGNSLPRARMPNFPGTANARWCATFTCGIKAGS